MRANNPRRIEFYELREPMIAETNAFINAALRNPKLAVHIPRRRVGTGGFSKQLQQLFWARVFGKISFPLAAAD